jgi:hypothetical protein
MTQVMTPSSRTRIRLMTGASDAAARKARNWGAFVNPPTWRRSNEGPNAAAAAAYKKQNSTLNGHSNPCCR